MDEATRIAELTQDLINTQVDESKMKTLAKAMGGIESTTEVLLMIAKMHENVEDLEGAERLRTFAKDFAAFEATVI